VYDGDTMTLLMPVDGKMWRFAARMYGIDTCEMRSKEAANRETAIRARHRVVELITGVRLGADAGKKEIVKLFADRVHVVRVECLDFDKYGRVLVRVLVPGSEARRLISDVLLEEKLAYPYFGDTKMTEGDQVVRLAAAVASNTI
jgi:endonuclease YncB( thermonuclease family)